MSDITDRIESLLDSKGLKRADVARATSIPESTLRNWIRGTSPQAEPLHKVAQYLGVTVEYLLTGEESEKAKSKTAANLSQTIESIMNGSESSRLNFDTRVKVAKHLENALSCLLTGEDKTEEVKKSEIDTLFEELSEENQKEMLEYARFKLNQQPKEASKAV